MHTNQKEEAVSDEDAVATQFTDATAHEHCDDDDDVTSHSSSGGDDEDEDAEEVMVKLFRLSSPHLQPIDEAVDAEPDAVHRRSLTHDAAPKWEMVCEGRLTLHAKEAAMWIEINAPGDRDTVLFSWLVQRDTTYAINVEDANEFLVWRDGGDGVDYTLSFANALHCAQVHKEIVAFQEQRTPMDVDADGIGNGDGSAAEQPFAVDASGAAVVDAFMEDDFAFCVAEDGGDTFGSMGGDVAAAITDNIPDCKLEHLAALEDYFTTVPPVPRIRRCVAQKIVASDFVPKLFEVFSLCENCDYYDGLFQIFNIVKAICKLENTRLLEILLHPEHVASFAAILEYDPKVREDGRKHDFVSNLYRKNKLSSIHRAVRDDLLALIEHTFRIQYFREHVFPQIMEEEPVFTLTILLRMCHRDLYLTIAQDKDFFAFIPALLANNENSDETVQRSVLEFLREFLNGLKSISFASFELAGCLDKNVVFTAVFDFLGGCLQRFKGLSREMSQLVIDVLFSFCEQSAAAIRWYLKEHLRLIPTTSGGKSEESGASSLIGYLISAIVATDNAFFRFELAGALKTILVAQEPGVDDDFVQLFFAVCAKKLIEPFVAFDRTPHQEAPATVLVGTAAVNASRIVSERDADMFYHLLDVVEFCVVNYTTKARLLVHRHAFVDALFVLLHASTNQRLLQAIVRFIKTLLSVHDDFYTGLLLKRNFLKPIMQLLETVGDTNTLLNSTLLSLFEKIRTEPHLRIVLSALVESHGAALAESFTYNRLFGDVLDAYEKLFENPPPSQPLPSSSLSFEAASAAAMHAEVSLHDDDENGGCDARHSADPYMRELAEEDYFSVADDDEDARDTAEVAVSASSISTAAAETVSHSVAYAIGSVTRDAASSSSSSSQEPDLPPMRVAGVETDDECIVARSNHVIVDKRHAFKKTRPVKIALSSALVGAGTAADGRRSPPSAASAVESTSTETHQETVD